MGSPMYEYDATAGFPKVHIEAFQRVAARMKLVISSRELNPLCTDLVLENYAAKGFHIKAKTCDWGPMAGFVPADPRFTKGSQDVKKQEDDLSHAFEAGARAVPLFISPARYEKLRERKLFTIRPGQAPNQVVATASSKAAGTQQFVLVQTNAPPGGDNVMWGIYYHPGSRTEVAAGHSEVIYPFPREVRLMPVMGMVNPENADGKLGVKAAVAGDYDLWCVFPHKSAKDIGLSDRAMPLRATLKQDVGPHIRQQAVRAGLVFASGAEKSEMARKLEDPHLGNISLGIRKVKDALNLECKNAGYQGGNVVQHSDYGGNPFGAIDYPLIFFIPTSTPQQVLVRVTKDINELKAVLREMTKLDYVVNLNPAWSVPNF